MNHQSVDHDERTLAVENSSYRWGYMVLAFGILVAVAYRGFALGQSSWDLLALVGISAFTTTLYQWAHRVLTGRWLSVAVTAVVLAALMGAVIAFGR